jgi:hypothetical protein
MYQVRLFFPDNFTELSMSQILTVCRQYDTKTSLSGVVVLWTPKDGLSCDPVIDKSQLLDFLHQLPSCSIISRIDYLPNVLSNGWIQTNEPSQPCEIYPVPWCEARPLIPRTQSVSQSETSTQTDPIECEESQPATESYSDKYDTEYSLEMWEFYHTESVVYCHPYSNDVRHASDIKHILTPFELDVVQFVREFERNLDPFWSSRIIAKV